MALSCKGHTLSTPECASICRLTFWKLPSSPPPPAPPPPSPPQPWPPSPHRRLPPHRKPPPSIAAASIGASSITAAIAAASIAAALAASPPPTLALSPATACCPNPLALASQLEPLKNLNKLPASGVVKGSGGDDSMNPKSLQSCEHVSKSMFPVGRCGFFHNGKFLGTVHPRCCCPPLPPTCPP